MCLSGTSETDRSSGGESCEVKVTQLCLTGCNPMDYPVHGILQARILEWVAFPFSRGSSLPRDRTQVSWTAGRFFTSWTTRESWEDAWKIFYLAFKNKTICPLKFPKDEERVSTVPHSLNEQSAEPLSAFHFLISENWHLSVWRSLLVFITLCPHLNWTTVFRLNSENFSSSVQFSCVAQLCPTLCDPMDCSMPGFPVHHQLPELAQTHVHWVGDAIQPSSPLLSSSPPAFNLSQHHGFFQWVISSYQVAKVSDLQLQHQSFQLIFKAD